ncbi:hypothetical protein [Algiphilus sp.]|uniref:hypothetical protein n=1 Tax=Algiphilus sp. TaxID=1872431 RepID=UPI003C3149C7
MSAPFPAPSPYLPQPSGKPWLIGLAHVAGGALPYPLSRRDIERDTEWALRVYQWMGLREGVPIHLVGDGAHEVLWWPFENAAMRLGIPWTEAESAAFDTRRTDMVLRRFGLQAVIGLSAPVVRGLLDEGRDLDTLLPKDLVLAATADGTRCLNEHGLRCWRIIRIGPIFAFEPPEGGGARYDEREWRLDASDGELRLTSLGNRAAPFVKLRTGIKGRVEERAGREGPERFVVLD